MECAFQGVDITASIRRFLLSITYTDNEEDEADDLQIKLHGYRIELEDIENNLLRLPQVRRA